MADTIQRNSWWPDLSALIQSATEALNPLSENLIDAEENRQMASAMFTPAIGRGGLDSRGLDPYHSLGSANSSRASSPVTPGSSSASPRPGYGTFHHLHRAARLQELMEVDETSIWSGNSELCYIVRQGDTLESIGRQAYVSADSIIKLNPHAFPKGMAGAKVYPGQTLILDNPDSGQLPPTPQMIDEGWGQIHIVRENDTMNSIAREYNTTVENLRRDNRQHFPVGEKGQLYPGLRIFIRLVNSVNSEMLADVDRRYETHPPPAPVGYVYHEVAENETWGDLVDAYHTSFKQILELNRFFFPIGLPAVLRPGQRLILFDPSVPRVSTESRVGECVLRRTIHQVKLGDTAESIAEQYGMTVAELRAENRNFFPSGCRGVVAVGSKMVVKNPAHDPKMEQRYARPL